MILRTAGKRSFMKDGSREGAGSIWYFLFIIPFAALLFPFYLKASPSLGGIPFFYWYQFAWLFVTVALTWFVYLRVRRGDE